MPSATAFRGALAALALLAALAASPAQAQSPGTVSGRVSDAVTGETLIGVNVLVQETSTGSATDLDGRYALRLPAGTYTLLISYIGYDRQTVENVRVTAGQTSTLDLLLTPSSAGLGEVVVQAEAIQATNTEASLLAVQARSPIVLDGISAQQIRRAPDANSGEALRRVTGVTLSGGKFIFVRGLPERYSGTLLNGTPIASTEPDRRAFAYDLIPASLLQSVLVAKTAAPDLPGDFAGGVLQLQTVDFPEEFTGSVSLSGGFNNTTGSPLLSGPRGGRDFLGVDDGTRSLPAGIPADLNLSSSAVTDAERGQFGRLLTNNWQIQQRNGPIAPNVSVALGGSSQTGVGRFGAIGALTYRSSYNQTALVRREYESADNLRFDYAGTQFANTVSLGGILNLAYRPSGVHSFSFKNFLSRTADDETTQLAGREFSALDADIQQTALRYLTRTIYAGQLQGEHFLQGVGRGLRINWDGYRASTVRDEPDYRRLAYFRPADADADVPFQALIGRGAAVDLSGGGRFYSGLDEAVWGGQVRATLNLGAARLTAGGLAETRDRAYTSRTLLAVQPGGPSGNRFDNGLRSLPIDRIFAPENFGDRGSNCLDGRPSCVGFALTELSPNGTNYDAGQDVQAAFLMLDAPLAPLSPNLRFVGGLRFERAVQRVVSTTLTGDPLNVDQPYPDLLPSVNLTYRLNQRTNVRTAYSRNVNRPELRELAPAPYYDFELQTTVYGNPDLTQARVNNFDLRVETFPRAGELLSGSVFYKRLTNPIELAIVPGVALNAERSFVNADFANVYGLEVESRIGLRNLGLGAVSVLVPQLATAIERSQIVFNYTRVFSDVEQQATPTSIGRSGMPLQGQSAYVLNLGVNLVAPGTGTTLNVLYNRLGSRTIEVATAFEVGDVIEQPRDVVDVSLTQPLLGGRYEFRLAGRDLLEPAQRFVQGADLVRENRRPRSLSFGVSARL